jgi:drug/metabolite transporter (DMT)-like permease
MTPRERGFAIAAYLFLCVVWGSTYIGIRAIVQVMSPFWFAGLRFVLCGLIMLGLCRIVKAPMPKKGEWMPLFIMALLFLLIGNGALSWASTRVQGGIASIVSPLSPLFIATIMAILPRGERLRPLGWLGILLGFIGVVVLVWDKLTSNFTASLGEIGLLVSVLGWSSGTIYTRFVGPRYHPFTLTTFEMLFGGAMLLALAVPQGAVFRAEPTAETWIWFAYMVLIGGCMAFVAFTYLVQKIPATKAGTYGYVNPAVALALGWLLIGESYEGHQLVGSAVVVVAVILVHVSKVSRTA